METKKFVCKFCNKRFPSGKSLGGHIRTHMNQHSSNKAIADSSKFSGDVEAATRRKKRKKRDLSSSDYGLRENPRKTKRFVHHHPFFTLHHKEKFCRECGKGFSSLKALCGHMACHSEKEKQNFSMMDAQPDTETSDPEDLKRTRFMTLNKNNNNTTSSSVSEVEQEEAVEEVAMCLILLSKGFYNHNKGRFSLNKESNSDNYSAILEAKSNSVDVRNGINDSQNKVDKNYVYNASDIVKLGKDKMKSKFSDSGYSKYGSKKEDSNVSIHGVLRNDVFNRPKAEEGGGYGFKDSDLQMMNNRSYRSKNSSESRKLVLGNSDKFDSYNSAKQEQLGHNLDEVSYKKKRTSFPNHEVSYNKDSYDSESYASSEKSTDSSGTDSDSFPYSYQNPNKSSKISSSKKAKKKKVMKNSKKKTKEHECPICNRTFRSGQALGGHKRSHFVGGFEENNNNIGIVEQDSPCPSSSSPSSGSPSHAVVPCLIDLNLPAPVDE